MSAPTLPGLGAGDDDWPEVAVPGGAAARVAEDQGAGDQVDQAPAGGVTASPPADETPAQPAAEVDDTADVVGQRRPVHAARPPAGTGKATRAPGGPPPASDVCRSPRCRQKIRWALTDKGEDMPVDWAPDPQGRLVRFMRAPGDWRIRVLKKGEDPPAGELRWTSHYATCPEATRFRGRDQPRPSPASSATPAAPVLEVAPPPGPARLLVVDGNSLAHRSFHALAGTGMRAPDGTPVWAVFGFVKLLAGVIERVRPDAVLVGFDDRAGSSRRDRYPDYKAGRPAKDPALYAQLDQLPGLLAELGVATLVPPALEADDVLASAAAAAERAGWKCTVATSDGDALRLVTDATTVLQLGNGLDAAVTVTPAVLEGKFGVTVAQYPDFCALVGDRSDNLPGVLGIGKTKAAQLLAAVGTLDAALDAEGRPTAAAIAAIGKGYAGKLAAPGAAEAIARNRDLMAPVATLPVDPEACRPKATGRQIAQVLKGRNMPSLIKPLVDALAGPDTTGARLVPVAEAKRAARTAPAAPATTDDGRVVRSLLAPSLEQLGAEQAEADRTCVGCGAVAVARVPVLGGAGESLLLVADHVFGEAQLVKVGDGWAAERIDGYGGNRDNRRTVHRCPTYSGRCMTPGHEDRPARLYPGGLFCDGCNESAATSRAVRSAGG
jgi:5'-3' exonuclease